MIVIRPGVLGSAGGNALDDLGVRALPQTVLISDDGEVRQDRFNQLIVAQKKVQVAALAMAFMAGRESFVNQHAVIAHAANDIAHERLITLSKMVK